MIVLYRCTIMNCGMASPASIVNSKIARFELPSMYKRSINQSHLSRQKRLPFLLEHTLQYSVSAHSPCLMFFHLHCFCFTDDPWMILCKRLTLFDIVLITIDDERYFGIIIHVRIDEIASNTTHTQVNCANFNINLMTTVQVYVSCQCATAFEKKSINIKSKQLEILKITNIKSIRSMINAIYDLGNWPQHRSFLNPTIDDEYFKLPENFNPKTVKRIGQFNSSQAKVITIAECMFSDLQERLHIVHGPPGKY
jgi:hypothetical protein